MRKTTDEGWNPYRLVILVQITQFCMHNTTGKVLDPERLVILVQKSLIFQAQNDMWGLGLIEIHYSDTKLAVLHAKTTDEGWNT